ncbi:hypothetical protein [Cellvibrio sp. UBA7671]|uniref:hypothetical protein n=1 Tax=Cellvibrio sp. UBA7671 TaxID=1946312 RepID=UPI002F352080
MKNIIFILPVLLTLISFQSHALIITDVRKDAAIREGYDGFSTDMIALGYNPQTDIVNSVRLFVRVHEIIDDSDIDMPGSDTSEFVIFYTMLFGARMHVYPDVDNESFEFVRDYFPGEDTCVIWGMFECDYDPVKTGQFGIGIAASTDNLWLDEARWELDITRTAIDEPSAPILFLSALLSLISCRYWQRANTKK